ncbi:MAG: hypothetical protein J7J96_04025 [Sulfurimonas sp.]|nr:hypothetical protein [Sulfurimonas sp.]
MKKYKSKNKLEKILKLKWKQMESNHKFKLYGKHNHRLIYYVPKDKIIRIYTDEGFGGNYYDIK